MTECKSPFRNGCINYTISTFNFSKIYFDKGLYFFKLLPFHCILNIRDRNIPMRNCAWAEILQCKRRKSFCGDHICDSIGRN